MNIHQLNLGIPMSLLATLTPKQVKANPYVEYFVEAAGKSEKRAVLASDIPKLPDYYKLVSNIGEHPVRLTRWVNPNYFYLLPFERTHFSEGVFVQTIKESTFESVESMFVYWFWESSTEALVTSGSPTATDVAYWIELLEEDQDFSDAQKAELIGLCKDYLQN